jgi:hypothetical protein
MSGMVNKELRQKIADAGFTNSIMYDEPSFDNSIIGVDDNSKVVYSVELMMNEFVRDDEGDKYDNFESLSEEEQTEYIDKRVEALEFIEFNTVRATPYMSTYGITPVILDYNPSEDCYYDKVSGENYDLDKIDLKFGENYEKFLVI